MAPIEALIDLLASCTKEVIKIDVLSKAHGLFSYLSPRIFLNDLGELRIRARSAQEAIKFLAKLIAYTQVRVALSSYRKGASKNPIIYVGQNFTNLQVMLCVAKIGINCLMYYYPASQKDKAPDPCTNFIMTGSGEIGMTGEQKDNIKDAGKGTHLIFFQQTTRGMHVRISFFNGAGGAYCFHLMGLMIMSPGEFNRLVIDYKSRTMYLQDRAAFLASFDQTQ